ncbi:hypothetical protein D6D13_05443 [Aureobasidium pullulans]|uniref:F-box domain-containing protein n=1 Tax=Aureobasidium pullulans TaxID=5580 RepID=A0A4S9CUQ2_AURPU|nr:hypothetical protein D6D13_05443 [Aureobasidium pullulans]
MPTAILLPPEIWDLVAATTNSNDLANLPLTNKTMNNAATRPFGLARLTNRRFIISPFSLKGLVELTAHPVLGRCLKFRQPYGFGELYGDLDLSMVGSRQPNLTLEAIGIAHALLWVQLGWDDGEANPIAWNSGFNQVVRLLVLSDHTLMPVINFVVKLCSDLAELHGPWHDSLMVFRSDRSMLLVNHSIMTIGMACGSNPNIYLSPYGDSTNILHNTLKLEILVLGGLTFEYAARSLRIVSVVTLRGPEIDARLKDLIAVTGVWMRDSTAHAGTLMLE